MPKLTREQYNKWNSKATNGFEFDIKEYVCWGEKTLIRQENLQDGKIGEFRLWYEDEAVGKQTSWCETWYSKTGNHIPTLRINILHPTHTEGMYQVHPFEKRIKLGEAIPKKSYDVLCRLAQTIDVDKYLSDMMKA